MGEREDENLVSGKIVKNNGGVLIVDLDGVGLVEIHNWFAASELIDAGSYLFDAKNLNINRL